MPKCTAKSARTGKPCNGNAIEGATVCRMHGGGAPQVKAKAALRVEMMRQQILEAAAPALARILHEIERETDNPNGVAVAAAKDILDRAGFKPTEKIEVSGPLAEKLLSARKRAAKPE